MAARGLSRVAELCQTLGTERKATFLKNALFLSSRYLSTTYRDTKIDGSNQSRKGLFAVFRENGFTRNQLPTRSYSVTNAALGIKEVSDEVEGAFEKFNISKTVQDNLRAKGINYLFPVQYTTFKHTIEGTDVVVQARTGTGKTLSFSLPLVEKLKQSPERLQMRGRKPMVLILAPTRELAMQVHEDFAMLDKTIKVLCVYGGASYIPQVNGLEAGVDVVVGTPGRMRDLIQKGLLSLQQVEHVILDEVDQMLDMGFQDQVDDIIKTCYTEAKRPQTMLYSATMPAWVSKTASRYLRKGYKHINLVGDKNEQTATTLKQYKMVCTQQEQASLIQDLIKLHSGGKRVIIFCNQKIDCDRMASTDFAGGSRVLHGDIQQSSRSVIMKDFKKQTFNVLITTDVAARGLDIADVGLVIQAEPPKDGSMYIHRVGRSGRAGKDGMSILLYGREEREKVIQCEQAANTRFETMPMPTLQQLWKVCSEDVQKQLENVPASIVAQFSGEAKKLIDLYGAPETVAAAIAVISNAERYTNRSLLTRLPGQTTLCIRTKVPVKGYSDAKRKVNNYLAAENVTTTNVVKLADSMGIVFDIPSTNVESFALEFNDLKESEDETLEKLTELPALMTANTFQSERYGQQGSDGSRRYGSRNEDYRSGGFRGNEDYRSGGFKGNRGSSWGVDSRRSGFKSWDSTGDNEGFRGGEFKGNRDSGWGQDRRSGVSTWDGSMDTGYGRERSMGGKFESRAQQGFQGDQQRGKKKESWNDSDDE